MAKLGCGAGLAVWFGQWRERVDRRPALFPGLDVGWGIDLGRDQCQLFIAAAAGASFGVCEHRLSYDDDPDGHHVVWRNLCATNRPPPVLAEVGWIHFGLLLARAFRRDIFSGEIAGPPKKCRGKKPAKMISPLLKLPEF